jgi:hypothetical protein
MIELPNWSDEVASALRWALKKRLNASKSARAASSCQP